MGIHHSPHTHTIPIPMGIPMGIPIPTAALGISRPSCIAADTNGFAVMTLSIVITIVITMSTHCSD